MSDFLFSADTLKYSHYYQWPPKTTNSYFYYSARKPFGSITETLAFGWSLLTERLSGTVVTKDLIEEAAEVINTHFNEDSMFFYNGWQHLVTKHGGALPLRIKAVPEGTFVPVGNVLLTVEATDPEFFWLPGFIETALQHLWYPTTIATISAQFKTILKLYVEKTGSPSTLNGLLNDFSARSATSTESQRIAGLAHLVVFDATSNVSAIRKARQLYKCPVPSRGIAAMDHGTVGPWGPKGEADAFSNMLELSSPNRLVSCVSDTYDIDYAIEEIWCKQLKDDVIERGGPVGIRLDSGDPATGVCRALNQLEDVFGAVTNLKGFKVLKGPYRIVQGDGISLTSIVDILEKMTASGYSTDNVVFGCGTQLAQAYDRDTFGFAYKHSESVVGGVARDVYKAPKGSPTKASLRGRQKLVLDDGIYKTVREQESDLECQLEIIFENGETKKHPTMNEIRDRTGLWA